MYQSRLTIRYLTSRFIPTIAVAAVALCVALVIVVVSVMTGFLNMVQSSGRTLMGDVVVTYGLSGIPHYDRLMDTIEQHESVEAVTPIVDGWGLLRMPYPDRDAKQSETVQVWGIEPHSFAEVTKFADSLQWKSVSENQRDWLLIDAIQKHEEAVLSRLDDDTKAFVIEHVNAAARSMNFESVGLAQTLEDTLQTEDWEYILSLDPRLTNEGEVHAQGLSLERDGKPAIVSGLHVSEGNERQDDGSYQVIRNDYWWLPRYTGTLTMLPIDAQGGIIEPESIVMPFANEFMSGVYIIDDTRIFVPLHVAQQLLHLDEAEIVDEDDPTETVGVDPAKVTSVLVRGVEGVNADDLRAIVQSSYLKFYDEMPIGTFVMPPPLGDPGLVIQTWEDQQRSFTGPVEKERELMRTLFSIIYLVVAALILSIFWSIVFEKTKDIGILRSIGASRLSVVWVFLQFALVIGVTGALLGSLLGWLITTNINAIHEALGNPPIAIAIGAIILGCLTIAWMFKRSRNGDFLPIVLGSLGAILFASIAFVVFNIRAMGGLVIWDASVYYFSHIPNDVDWNAAIITSIGAVVFCLIGAAIPSAKAADIDPVKALRHE